MGNLFRLPAQHVAMSTAPKQLGVKFVGPTTCYALMQSVGMVLDHLIGSPEWKQAKRVSNAKGRLGNDSCGCYIASISEAIIALHAS